MTTPRPIACDLSSIKDAELEEHRRITEAVFEAISEIREIENGFKFKLPADTELIQIVSSFVVRERRCCPFFDFTLSIPSNHRPVWLQLSGRNGGKSYIKETLLPKLDLPVKSQKQPGEKAIDPDRKVAKVLEQYPKTYKVFRSYGCPDMRGGFFSLMARFMNVRNAARIHRISLDELLADLGAVASEEETSNN